MASRYLTSRVDRFAGLSDRSPATSITRIENPDLLNIDFSDRALVRRKGFTRLTTECMKDSSGSFNGFDDFARIRHTTAYDPSTALGVSFHVRLSRFPAAEATVLSRGYGTGANRFLQISYDPTINSNAGGWRCRIYDSGVGLQNVTVNDANAVGQDRLVALYHNGVDYDFEVFDEDGSQVGSTATATVAAFISDSNDWIIGCDTADGDTVPSASANSYTGMLFGELRLDVDPGTAPSLLVAGRELYVNAAENEITSDALTGYWKFNDGAGSTITDYTSTGNDGVMGSAGFSWTNDRTKINGLAGLEFQGDVGHIQVDTTSTGTTVNAAVQTFLSSGPWCFTFLLTPKLAAGETTVRDQTLFWSGTNATDPEPLGIRIESDNLKVYWQDTASTKSQSLTAVDLSDKAGVRGRVFVDFNATNPPLTITTSIYWEDGTFSTDAASPLTVLFTNSGNVSYDWSFGRKLTSFAQPPTFPSGEKSAFCYLSDIAVYGSSATAAPYTGRILNNLISLGGVVPPNSLANFVDIEFAKNIHSVPGNPTVFLALGLALDEGVGNTLNQTGTHTGGVVLLPEERDTYSWGPGLVCPNDPPEITLLRDYRRIQSDGTFKRSMLAISGSTLYEIDPSDGSFLKTFGVAKGGKWSHTQYADTVYLASENRQVPIAYDGDSVTAVGIAPPQLAPVVTGSTSGGGIADGTYYFYVTYRNSTTGAESNPSPAGSVTISGGGGNGSFTAVTIPVSPDPQVNERRIWATDGTGIDGSTAYLMATVPDNALFTYSTAITTQPATPTLEYLANEQAPPSAYVLSWKDRLWLSGNPDFPTRVYYSAPGTLTSFRTDTQFLDADQDAGDPVVGLKNLRDELIVYLRDGRVSLTATGDTTTPFFLSHINNDVGAVSHHSILIYENRHIFLGERDVWLWAGEDAQNLSSPADIDRTSVKNYIRETLADAYKKNAHIALLRARDQVWLACTTGSNTRNDQVLVLDISQGIWSKYQMDMDVIAEIEDSNDEPQLYGGSRGWIVKLDDGVVDGLNKTVNSSGTGTTSFTQNSVGGVSDDYSGCYAYIYHATSDTVERRRIARNTTTTVGTRAVYYFTEALSENLAVGDTMVIGSIQAYADFVVDVGSPMSLKRLRWVKLAGYLEDDSLGGGNLRVFVQPDQVKREWTFNGSGSSQIKAWASGDVIQDYNFGGLGRSFRVMVSDSANALYPVDGRPFPVADDRIFITEFQVEVEEVSAR